MDLAGAAKHRFRTGLMHLWAMLTGLKFIPREECIFGLGAQYAKEGSVLVGSEYETFTKLHMSGDLAFIQPHQYVSVEGKKKAIYYENMKLKGPRAIWGDFAKALREFSVPGMPPIALLNADFMCGIDTALASIKTIFECLASGPISGVGTLIAINVIADHRQARVAWGHKFAPAMETLKAQSWFRALLTGGKGRDVLRLVDNFPYDNIPVGPGAGCVKMQTLVFWWGPNRRMSGIRGWAAEVKQKQLDLGVRHCGKCGQPGHYQSTCGGKRPAQVVEDNRIKEAVAMVMLEGKTQIEAVREIIRDYFKAHRTFPRRRDIMKRLPPSFNKNSVGVVLSTGNGLTWKRMGEYGSSTYAPL